MTTDPPVPDAAVQIAAAALAGHHSEWSVRLALAALHAAGWLHDPARVAELEAENKRLRVDWSRASFAERPLTDR